MKSRKQVWFINEFSTHRIMAMGCWSDWQENMRGIPCSFFELGSGTTKFEEVNFMQVFATS